DHANIILDDFREGPVGAKLGRPAPRAAVGEFGRVRRDAGAAPAATGLDAKIVVTVAGRILRLRRAPAGLERGLRDDGARVDAKLACRGRGVRQHAFDELALLLGRNLVRAGGTAGRGGVRAGLQLSYQHVGEPQALALGQRHRELIVHHALVHLDLVAAEQRIAKARLTHALQHHLREDTLELARDFAQRLRIVVLGATAQRRELTEIVRVRRAVDTLACQSRD